MKTNAPKFSAEQHASVYTESQLRFVNTISTISSSDELLVVQSCPDWNIHDLLSHVTGLCVAISQGDTPPADTQNWVDQQVLSRRIRSSSQVVEEWRSSITAFCSTAITDMRLAMPLTYDLLVHEFDLLHALNKPSAQVDRDSQILAMNVAALILDGDISNANVGSLLLVANEFEWQCGSGEVIATLDLSTASNAIFELIRLTGSRRSQKQLFAYPWQGDFERIFPVLSHMELPTNDIIE